MCRFHAGGRRIGPSCLFCRALTRIHGWTEKKFTAEFTEKGREEEIGYFEQANCWAQRRHARTLCTAGATGSGIKGHDQRPGDGQQRDASLESKVWRQGQAHRRIVIPCFGADRERKIRRGCCRLCRHGRKKCSAARTFRGQRGENSDATWSSPSGGLRPRER